MRHMPSRPRPGSPGLRRSGGREPGLSWRQGWQLYFGRLQHDQMLCRRPNSNPGVMKVEHGGAMAMADSKAPISLLKLGSTWPETSARSLLPTRRYCDSGLFSGPDLGD